MRSDPVPSVVHALLAASACQENTSGVVAVSAIAIVNPECEECSVHQKVLMGPLGEAVITGVAVNGGSKTTVTEVPVCGINANPA